MHGVRVGAGPWYLTYLPSPCLSQSSKKRNRKHSGDDSFDEGSVSESESESESGQAEEEKEEAGRHSFSALVQSLSAEQGWEGGEVGEIDGRVACWGRLEGLIVGGRFDSVSPPPL